LRKRQGRDGKNADPMLISQALTRKQDAVQTRPCAFEKRPTIDRQFDAAMETPEQPRPEMILKGTDLMTDGTLGQSEFVCGPCE
jgi:hypothetical protein